MTNTDDKGGDTSNIIKTLSEEDKQKQILLTKFENLSRYMEDFDVRTNHNVNSWTDYLFDDNDLADFNMDRLTFYMELTKILSKDPQIIRKLLSVNNRTKKRIKDEAKIFNEIRSLMKEYASLNENHNIDNINTSVSELLYKQLGLESKPTELRSVGGAKYLNKYFPNIDTDTGKISNSKKQLQQVFDKKEHTVDNEDKLRGYLAYKYNLDNLPNLTQNILKMKNSEDTKKFQHKKNSMQEFIDDYYEAHNENNETQIAKKLEKALDKLDSASDNVLERLKISREDRLIFILVTFFIRYITLMLVQWCIDINIVRDFYQGFLLYALIYVVIFWFIVMFVNVNTLPYANYIEVGNSSGVIQNMFYYFYMGTNGISRLLTHTFMIIILLIIPILLNINDKKENADELLSYDERKKLLKTLSLFTIFIWVLTSIIATKF